MKMKKSGGSNHEDICAKRKKIICSLIIAALGAFVGVGVISDAGDTISFGSADNNSPNENLLVKKVTEIQDDSQGNGDIHGKKHTGGGSDKPKPADKDQANAETKQKPKAKPQPKATPTPMPQPQPQGKKIINVPYINQNEIASGCEAVSATMLLQHHGFNISAREFTDQFLIKKDWRVGNNNVCYGADPRSAYVGNPYVPHGRNCGFGCYAPALVKSMNGFLQGRQGNSKRAEYTFGMNLADIVKKYIDKDTPVLIWATMNMKPSREGMHWIVDYVDENAAHKQGDQFKWIAGEHCLVLVGYDAYSYYFNDPYQNHGIISYEKGLVEARFAELGKQSAVIVNK